MSVFTMADLHLSTLENTNKSMEVFGNRWIDYQEKIRKRWSEVVNESDTVVIPGDISWATKLEEAESDFRFIASLPGRKIIGKGNHDFWWSTVSKMTSFFNEKNIHGIEFLYNNALVADNLVIAGTRGWFPDIGNAKIPENSDYEKLVSREAARLKISLENAVRLRDASPLPLEIAIFLHFPPVWNSYAMDDIINVIADYGVRNVYFGHIHGTYNVPATVTYNGIMFSLISSDYLDFTPKLISH